MAHFKFVIRTHKGGLDKQGNSIIFLRYTHRTKVTYFSVGRSIKPEFWDKRNGQVRQAYKGYNAFNVYLAKFRQGVEDKVHDALSKSIDPTVEYIRDKIRQKKDEKVKQLPYISFFDFVEQYIGISILSKKEGTLRSYRNTVRRLKEFEKYSGEKLTFDSFDMDFYEKFNYYIIEERGCGNNYFGKHIRSLKSMLSQAMERGYNVNPSFKKRQFATLNEEAENIYLDESEIKRILDLDLSDNPKLEKVRDLFVSSCYLGLRYSDLSQIKPENIANGCISMITTKTQQKVVIPLHPIVKDIMNKYEGVYPNSFPPALSNQKMNKNLKILGEKAKINESIIITRTKGTRRVETVYKKYELITTHTGRRSFATNLFKQGFPSISIMKVTGHKTEKAFLRYIKVREEESAQMLKAHWDTYYQEKPGHLYKIA